MAKSSRKLSLFSAPSVEPQRPLWLTRVLSFKNHLRNRLLRRMRNAHRDILHSQRISNLPRFAPQRQTRTAAPLTHHFHVHPPPAAAPARPQGLHRRLFHRKPPRIPLIFVPELLAIRHLVQREHAPQKSLPLRFNHFLNPRHFRHIDSHANDHLLTRAAASPLPRFLPFILLRLYWSDCGYQKNFIEEASPGSTGAPCASCPQYRCALASPQVPRSADSRTRPFSQASLARPRFQHPHRRR